MAENPGDVTQLLESWQEGDSEAFRDLMPLIYQELRTLAARHLRRERQDHTLQPTALVNEAYMRLAGQNRAKVGGRVHFLSVAAQAMRRVLVDHARRHQAGKRIGKDARVTLITAHGLGGGPDTDVLAIHQALELLKEVNERQAKLVELRHFGGLTNPEAAEVLGVSLGTVERDWKLARLWLFRKLRQQ